MIEVRKSKERGHFDHGWLDTFHTFSFGDYYDTQFMGFSILRVINEDKIDGGGGFPTHPHKDMEIVSYVVEGALEHQDTLGNKTIIRPGEVQRMTAGTGIRHSEANHFKDKKTHLLQIWFLPKKKNESPGYAQKSFLKEFETHPFVLVGSESGQDNSIVINQDLKMYVGKFQKTENINYKAAPHRNIWIQLVKGQVKINGVDLSPGDGAAISDEKTLSMDIQEKSEFLLFDLP